MDQRSHSVKDRIGYIGSTDAKRILDGQWLELWEEKTGRRKPEDLSHVFRVQLGIHTEDFHAKWLHIHSDFKNRRPPDVNIHPRVDWLRTHLDRWLTTHDTWLELKHCHERMTPWEAAEYYLPQCAHHCLATNTQHGFLSYIAGNQDPTVVKIEPPEEYMLTLLELEKTFWWHVTSDTQPEQLPEGTMERVKQAGVKVVVNSMRRVDMKGNNAWADAAADYREHKATWKKHEQAKKTLKELVEKDVAEASGHGVTIKRDTRGALRFVGEE
jgi:hypothetical protein